LVDKATILSEIRRTAADNGGVALGRARFFAATGIRETDWLGRYWRKWSDAVREAGATPNRLQQPFGETQLLERLSVLVQRLGHFPVRAELKLEARRDRQFPSPNVFARFGNKKALAARLLRFALERPGSEAVVQACLPLGQEAEPLPEPRSSKETLDVGFVYLMML
jgi:hypothetical protein